MRIKIAAITLLLALFATGCSGNRDEVDAADGADLILINGRVYTLNWAEPGLDGTLHEDAPQNDRGWYPDAEAVVVDNGEIEFVGGTSDAMKYQGNASRVVDLAGATVIPGLVDSHTHVFGVGANLERVDLHDVDTEEEAVRRVVERAASVPEGEWIIGRGWDEGAWANRYPDKVLLSEAVPDHPVFLDSLHGFAGWANQKALDVAGITADTVVPVGGEMRLGADGQPSGLFLNRATTLLDDAVPPPSREVLIQRVLAGLNQMAKDGYVAVHDAGLGTEAMSVQGGSTGESSASQAGPPSA